MENEFLYGVQVMAIGMGVVFASLLALSYVMVLLERFFGEKKTKLPEKGLPSVPSPKQPITGSETGEVPPEVVAVIAGTIAAYLDTAPEGVRIGIVRRQLATPFSAWSMAGRQELMNLRQLG